MTEHEPFLDCVPPDPADWTCPDCGTVYRCISASWHAESRFMESHTRIAQAVVKPLRKTDGRA